MISIFFQKNKNFFVVPVFITLNLTSRSLRTTEAELDVGIEMFVWGCVRMHSIKDGKDGAVKTNTDNE